MSGYTIGGTIPHEGGRCSGPIEFDGAGNPVRVRTPGGGSVVAAGVEPPAPHVAEARP